MGPFMAYGPESPYFANLNYSAYQSKNGYLWFGTSNGLIRFDGRRYKNFFSDHSNPNSPSDNIIVNFAEDKNDNLWMTGFMHGVTCYNYNTGTFKKYPTLSKDNFVYYGVNNVLCDTDKELWFATAGRGLAKYNYAADSFELFYPEPDKCKDGSVRGDNYLTDICQDKNDKNILWCTGFHGLFAFNKVTYQFTKYISGLKYADGSEGLFNDAEAGNNSILWLASYGWGLIEFNTSTKQFTAIADKTMPPHINDIKKINDSILYLACFDKGLAAYNIITQKIENITPTNYSYAPKNTDPGIQRISITKDAGIFIGGKYYFYQQHPAFERLKTNINYYNNTGLDQNKLLTGIIWDDYRKKYWITTLYGNGIYEMSAGKKTALPVKYLPGNKNAPYEMFSSIIMDGGNSIWAIKKNTGLYRYNDEIKMFTVPENKWPVPDSLKKFITHLATDKKGNIWAFAKNYFIYNDIALKTFEQYPLQWHPEFKGQKKNNTIQFKEGLEDNAFLFTENGIFSCSRNAKKVTHIFKTGLNKDSLSSPAIKAATVNRYNALWISNGSNLQVMHSTRFNILANHDIDHGLPSMTINDLISDSSGKIWASTGVGLAMFNPKAKYWRLYNRFDGIENDYLDLSTFITTDNKIAIDQANGFILKDINEIVATPQQPLLRISSLRINDSTVAGTALAEKITAINLSYKENNITIEYAAMDWLYPLQTTYIYWVDGLAQLKQTPTSPDARINLYGLAPGKYAVHLKALNNSGVWSNEVILTIIINPPFWLTWWFITLCIFSLLGLLYLFYNYRIKQLSKLQLMRNNISRNLHDDIGASLSNINILTELAKRNKNNPEKSTEYLDKAGEDIQYISQNLSDIVWNINPMYDNAESLFIRMKRYAADMFDGKDILYTFNFPEDVKLLKLPMEKRRDLYLFFKEAVNNLAKYSKAGNAVIILQTAANKLQLTIKDDGVGFNFDTIKKGNGLHNMQQRAINLKGALKITTAPQQGTVIELTIPV